MESAKSNSSTAISKPPFFSFNHFSPSKAFIATVVVLLLFSLSLVVYFSTQYRDLSFLQSIRSSDSSKPLFINLESPVDGAIASNDEILIEGMTLPDTVVVFYTETDENSVESDKQGKFRGTISLSSGINTVVVTAFGDNGQEKSLNLNLVYDEEV